MYLLFFRQDRKTAVNYLEMSCVTIGYVIQTLDTSVGKGSLQGLFRECWRCDSGFGPTSAEMVQIGRLKNAPRMSLLKIVAIIIMTTYFTVSFFQYPSATYIFFEWTSSDNTCFFFVSVELGMQIL